MVSRLNGMNRTFFVDFKQEASDNPSTGTSGRAALLVCVRKSPFLESQDRHVKYFHPQLSEVADFNFRRVLLVSYPGLFLLHSGLELCCFPELATLDLLD